MWHLVRPAEEVDEGKSKRGSVKEKERTKAITEIYLTRLLSVKVGAVGGGEGGAGRGVCVGRATRGRSHRGRGLWAEQRGGRSHGPAPTPC